MEMQKTGSNRYLTRVVLIERCGVAERSLLIHYAETGLGGRGVAPAFRLRYNPAMATITNPAPGANTVDLTGLPEPVAREIHQLVRTLREEHVPEAVPPTPAEFTPVVFHSDPQPTREEFRTLLDRMAGRSSGQSLPADFSRADLYDDHD